MMSEQKYDDSTWEVKLKDKNPDAKKSVELNVILKRSWYDGHKRVHYNYYLQKIEVSIPDTPEFYPLFLSILPFQPFGWKKIGRKEQKLIFHNLFEGATQSISLGAKSLAFSHARVRLLGKETPISAKLAMQMVREGKIYKAVEGEVSQDTSETWL